MRKPAEGGAYSVYFPDLPGCISYGKDFETALSEAQDALGLHIYGMEKDGEPVPAPSKNPEVDPDTAPGYLVSPVSVYPELVSEEIDNRRVKMNVTIPAWVKELAAEKGLNSSRLLEAAILDAAQVCCLARARAETTGRQVIWTWPCTACRNLSAALLGLPARNCPPC